MIARFYERIGDHAENIGERIHYAITGYRAERAAAERARARRDNPDPDAPIIKSRGLAVVDSITEERRIDAIRRDFVANVSHELKTPVAALSLLVESLRDETDHDVRGKLLGHAERETGRLDSIIDDLIELARLEDADALSARPTMVDEIVAASVDAGSALAERRGILLSVTGLPSHTEMQADMRQVVRALTSLIDNAVRYSDEGSSVTVGVDVLPDTVELSVRDTGIGIARPELERIFERFYRVDRARSRDTGGTGLGLAIVRHVVDNHNGRVLVESKPDDGSTFTMSLPLRGTK